MSTIRRSVSAIPGARRTGLAALRALTTATMLFGSVAVGISSASAQADEDEGTYESPTFGYTLEWNADDWTVEDESEADNNGGRDFLYLFDQDATTQLYAEGSEDSWDDPEDCVSTLLDELNVDPDDGEVIEDADGEDIETSDDDRAAAAYLFAADDNGTQDGREPVKDDLVIYAFCFADSDSDVIVGFSGRSILTDDWGTDGYDVIEPVIGSLPFADLGASSGNNDDETPEASSRGGNNNDDETPEASSRGGNNDDETPEADTGLVEDGLYVSPTYGFELEFDDRTWSVSDEGTDDDVDMLLLTTSFENEAGDDVDAAVTVMGFTDRDGAAGCLDLYLDILDDKGDGDAEYVVNDDGDPLTNEIDPDQLYSGYYFFSQDDDQFASYVVCASLGGDELLTIEFTSTPDGLADDAAVELSDDILAGISF